MSKRRTVRARSYAKTKGLVIITTVDGKTTRIRNNPRHNKRENEKELIKQYHERQASKLESKEINKEKNYEEYLYEDNNLVDCNFDSDIAESELIYFFKIICRRN